MPDFRYRAQNESGKVVEGVVQAPSIEFAAELVEDKDLTIITISEEKTSALEMNLSLFDRVSGKDLVIFSRQLSFTVAAGIPLVQGLRMLVEQTENHKLQSIVSEVADDVEGGAKLSDAMERHEKIFSHFYISIVKSGETSGKLEEVLEYLADQFEKDYDLNSKIRGAMIYPIFILTGLLVVGSLMMVTVIPQLTAILVETGSELPLSTKILIGTSNFFVNFWWLMILLVIGVIVGIQFTLRTSQGRYYWDLLKLKIPIFGKLQQRIILVRFTRSLHTLLAGGVTLSRSLEIVAEVAGNEIYRNLIMDTYREVESGNSIATVLADSPHMPVMIPQMLSLGEKTGRVDQVLEKLSGFYSREVDNMVTNLVALLEPLLMMLMGIAVGLLVAAVIVPVYNLATSF